VSKRYVAVLVMMQVGVGDRIFPDQLRAIVSADQSYTTLIESNFTLLTTALTDRLTDILCNSQHSHDVNHIFVTKCVLPKQSFNLVERET